MQLSQLLQSSKTWLMARLSAKGSDALVVLAIVLTSTGLMLVLKQLGQTQHLELMAYDRAVYLRGNRPQDNRFLVVGITEDYINETGKINPSDDDLLTALNILGQYNPAVIGLDLYRNTPQEGRDAVRTGAQPLAPEAAQAPAWTALLQRLQQPDIISIRLFASLTNPAIPPPPGVSSEQVAFNDLLLDEDGVVRRGLLMGWARDPVTGDNQSFHFSLPMVLAQRYLEQTEGLLAKNSDRNPDYLDLGAATFVPLQADSGGYDQGDAEGYQFLLNYHSRDRHIRVGDPDSTIPSVSFLDVLNGELSPQLVEDRIVLIGGTAATLKDLFATPYSRPDQPRLPGVFIHAQIASQILDAALGARSLIWWWSSWQELLWILTWTTMSGVFTFRCRSPWRMGVGWAMLLGGQGGLFYGALMVHGWIPVVAPMVGSVVTMAGVLNYRAQQAQQQRNVMKSLLGQSISPTIADELWRSRTDLVRSGKLPGQRLTATVLFSDIKGFSTLSEQQSPEELLEWLNEYLKEMIEAVTSHGGIVNKFTGDGLLAVFGVPVKRTEAEVAADARQSVRCAVAMGQALHALNQKWQDQGRLHVQAQRIQMRVGIFTGAVTAGSIGSKERLEYGVIGDSVNTASRLESCLKARQDDDCRILIARETMQHLMDPEWFESPEFKALSQQDGPEFTIPFTYHEPDIRGDRTCLAFESWGPQPLKGKAQTVTVYRVIGVTSNHTGALGPTGSDPPRPWGNTFSLGDSPHRLKKSLFITEP